ncbi:MAG: PAS domain S-box protein, partial [Spirochaetales bacterium]|nr:PAS domain S-box protein [Spirochaetales bacterium]
FEKARDGVFVINAKDGSVIQVDKPLIKLLGCSGEAMLGHKLWEVSCFGSTAQAKKIFRDFHKKKHFRFTDIRLCTDDGRILYVEIATDVYSAEGYKLIECTLRDITDRRRYEKSLEKRVAKNNQLKTEFRTQTLQSFGMITNMLSLKAMDNEDRKSRRVIGEVIHRIRSISDLNAILDESRKSSEIQLDVYCGKIIRSVLPADKRYRIQKSVGAICITSRQAELTGMILVELLSNIVRHAFSGNVNPLIIIRVWKLASRLLMSVEDNGIGMPEDAEVSKNHGIGLSLVNMMVGQLKGHIRIEKKNGTRVVIQYPL